MYATKPDWTACDDGNACTDADKCMSGKCSGTGLNCDDGNPCTTDTCDAAQQKCVFTPNAAPCDDGNRCTYNDVCTGGKCTGGAVLNCKDANV